MEMPAYCGYFCSQCPIYRAGACGNGAAREAAARRYSTENRPPFRRGYSLRGLPGTSGKTGGVLPGLLYSGLRGEKAAAALWRL